MALTFHQLHIFYTVAQKGSFSAAAQALHMTQPAVTMQVQGLEDYFGTRLFHRSTKRTELTEAGKTLLPFAHQGIELMKSTDEALAAFTHKLHGQLALGASLTIGEYILPRILGAFSREYPEMGVNLKVMNTTQIVEGIRNHQLTFGLVEAPVNQPDLRSEAVMNDELKLIIPKEHPLFGKDSITAGDALNYPFVLREQGSGTRQVMEEALKEKGNDPAQMRINMELGSTGAVKSAVEAGLGLSILSEASVKHEVALGLMRAASLSDVRFVRSFYSILLDTTILPIPAVTFLSFLKRMNEN